MEKRVFKRMPSTIECHCCNIECFGTITNLSAKGMFMRSQKLSFPLESQFEICIPLKEKVLAVRVKVIRLTKSNSYYDGIGIELLDPSQEYLNFVSTLVV